MPRFAPYQERTAGGERGDAPEGLRVRPAAPEDRDAVAALVHACDGGTLEEHRAGFEKEIAAARADTLVLVAEADGRLAGWARARWFSHPPEPPANVAPEGYYLSGVIVSPAFRRRGAAAELTRRACGGSPSAPPRPSTSPAPRTAPRRRSTCASASSS